MKPATHAKKLATLRAREAAIKEQIAALEPPRVPKPATRPRAIRLPDTLWAKIEADAGADGSVNAVVVKLLSTAYGLPVAP